MLQRARVPATAKVFADSAEKIMLYTFREHLKSNFEEGFTDKAVSAINSGQARLEGMEAESVRLAIDVALQSVIAISDLRWALIRNHTAHPFVFGDCPCVFYNKYLYTLKHRGVLGMCTPGLIIFFPIDEHTLLMLYDGDSYTIKGNSFFVDLTSLSDLSQLNALQLYAAINCIYFATRDSSDYLMELVAAHRCNFSAEKYVVAKYDKGTVLIDGKPNNSGEVLHMHDCQIPHCLDVSFLSTRIIPLDGKIPWSRNKEIEEELNKLTPPGWDSNQLNDVVADVEKKLVL